MSLEAKIDMAQAAALRSTRFRAEREKDWHRLEDLLARTEARGTRALGYGEARDLARLYRETANALSVARAISLDKALLAYLEALSARAYLAVYAPQMRPARVLERFLALGAPRAIRAAWPAILLSTLVFFLGAAAGGLLYLDDPAWFRTFVPPGLAQGRGPGASTETLRAVIEGGEDQSGLAAFAAYLFSNNTMVAIFAFGLGAFAALPTVLLLFYNGAILGVFVALYAERGLGWALGGWLSVHGVTEIAAILLAGAGGMLLGGAVLFPGRSSRRAALAGAGRNATKLALTAALMLVVAALLEGFVRQLVQDTATRYAIGWGIGAAWLLWMLAAGRGGGARP